MTTLSPPWRKALVVTAVGWLGTDFTMLAFGISGLAGADPELVYPAMALIGTVVFAPLSLVVWVVGVANSLLTHWGVFRWWWVVAKLAITTLMLVLVVVLLLPGLGTAADLGAALPAADRANMVVAPSVSTTLMLVATVLSTYKPWGRTPYGERARRRPAPATA